MRHLARVLRILTGVPVALALCACTVVHVQGSSKDDVAVYRDFGFVNVNLRPGARSVVVNSSSLGVINTLEGLAVGYHNTTYAALAPDDCRIVLWIRADQELKELVQFLGDRTNICVVQPTSYKGETP